MMVSRYARRRTTGLNLGGAGRVTALHNGVLVQNNAVLTGETLSIGTPSYRPYATAPIKLQAHGDPSPPLSFRNIWVRELGEQ